VPAKKKQKLGGRTTGSQFLQAPPATVRPWSIPAAFKRHALQIAGLWILTLAVYSNSFEAGLVFDNAVIIGHDQRIRAATAANLGLIFTREYWYPSTFSGLYRPLTTLSYLGNYSVLGNGAHPGGYHLVNLALHDINVVLVYALGLIVLGSSTPAFAMAALWAVHPLLTESVTNIVGRADLLAAFGVLAGLLCYLQAISSTGWRQAAWLVALAGAQTVGILSKESAAVLPALMILSDFTVPRKAAWRARILSYAVLLVPFGAFFYLRSQVDTHLVVHFGENALIGAGFWTQRITAMKVIGKFLWLFIWPARMSADYSYNAVPLFGWRPDWEDAKALIAIAACAGFLWAAIRFRRLKPLLFFAGFFFIALLPSSNLLFPIGSIMAERFMYLPALALCGCVVVALQQIKLPYKWIALAAVCLAFGARTYARNTDWRNNETLWSSAVAAYPGTARAHFALAVALAGRSDIPNAIAEFETALRIRPDYADSHVGLGNALVDLPGRASDAIAHYQEALKLDPKADKAHYNLGILFARTPERIQDAIAEWQAELRIQPDFAEAHYNLGTAYSHLPGRLKDAIPEFQTALRLNPDYVDAHTNLGSVYAQLPGRLPEAIAEFKAALRIRPGDARAHMNLGSLLSRTPGRMPQAIAQYQQAIQLQPGLGEAHYHLGMVLLQTPGRERDGLAELEAALRIDPDPEGQRIVDELRAHLR
jgi:tetratricopeptide (TPR) repeat protein